MASASAFSRTRRSLFEADDICKLGTELNKKDSATQNLTSTVTQSECDVASLRKKMYTNIPKPHSNPSQPSKVCDIYQNQNPYDILTDEMCSTNEFDRNFDPYGQNHPAGQMQRNSAPVLIKKEQADKQIEHS